MVLVPAVGGFGDVCVGEQAEYSRFESVAIALGSYGTAAAVAASVGLRFSRSHRTSVGGAAPIYRVSLLRLLTMLEANANAEALDCTQQPTWEKKKHSKGS